MTTFKELGISEPVIKAMKSMGWTEPTPVQIASVPYGLEGHDLFAQAQTGTGKTAAYTSIILGQDRCGIRDALGAHPHTHQELAIQVSEEIDRLSQFTDHICTVIYGGVSMTPQITRLKRVRMLSWEPRKDKGPRRPGRTGPFMDLCRRPR